MQHKDIHPDRIETYLRSHIQREPDELVRMYLTEYLDSALDPTNPDYPFPTDMDDDLDRYIDRSYHLARIQAAADRLVQAVYGQLADYVAVDPICPTPSRLVVMLVDDQREIEIHLSDAEG